LYELRQHQLGAFLFWWFLSAARDMRKERATAGVARLRQTPENNIDATVTATEPILALLSSTPTFFLAIIWGLLLVWNTQSLLWAGILGPIHELGLTLGLNKKNTIGLFFLHRHDYYLHLQINNKKTKISSSAAPCWYKKILKWIIRSHHYNIVWKEEYPFLNYGGAGSNYKC